MVTYHFYADHAARYGLPESVLLYNLVYWLRKNKAEGRNSHDGRTWTYNSAEGLVKQFSFWSIHQVRRYVDSLRDQGVILTGNYSQDRRDRSLWIALVDESMMMFDAPPPALLPPPAEAQTDSQDAFRDSAKCNSQDREMDVANLPNGRGKSARTYKDTDTKRSNSQRFSTLNVGDEVDKSKGDGQNGASSASLRAEAVAEIVEMTGDERSRKRFSQLHDIAMRERAPGLWGDALQATQRRQADTRKGKLDRPGAYFCSVLVSLLEDRGITVPAGSAEERADVRGLIGESLGAANV